MSAANWHRSPAAIGIIIAMRELNALHERLGHVTDHCDGPVNSARTFIGRYGETYAYSTWNRGYQRITAPDTNCSAIGQLWEALDDLRSAAINAQQEADGFRPILSHGAGEADFEHHRQISDAAPTVEEVILGFGRSDSPAALADAA